MFGSPCDAGRPLPVIRRNLLHFLVGLALGGLDEYELHAVVKFIDGGFLDALLILEEVADLEVEVGGHDDAEALLVVQHHLRVVVALV